MREEEEEEKRGGGEGNEEIFNCFCLTFTSYYYPFLSLSLKYCNIVITIGQLSTHTPKISQYGSDLIL